MKSWKTCPLLNSKVWALRSRCLLDDEPLAGGLNLSAKKHRKVHTSAELCTCPHRVETLRISSGGDPGRDWTFISGLAGRCSIQLSYGATIETPRIPSPWRLRFVWVLPSDIHSW